MTMEAVLGIDTGGTFTDAVLLGYQTKKVQASAKALTTRYDLTAGILNAVDALSIQSPDEIKLVCISTTLATNAIAEGQGKRVALFLIGYDEELVRAFNFDRRFATPRYFFFRGGHDLFGQPQAPLDLDAIRRQAAAMAPEVEAFAVSGYFSPLNPEHEVQACKAILEVTGLPVVQAHQLSTKLDSIERATTASLNAALVSVLRDFITGIRAAMKARAIDAPIMIVRGDGTLMSAEAADQYAVETIHSGPAASAIGGQFLSGRDSALIVDIGGTTTDIALVEAGQVTINDEGATVAGYRTAVKAANLRSFGLGGDSWLTFDKEDHLRIGPTRVVPLTCLAAQHPRVHAELMSLAHKPPRESLLDSLEYWFLLRGDAGRWNDPRVSQLIDRLRAGPRPLPELLKALGLAHPLQLSAYQLIEREVIGRAALTPTDLLHAQGTFTRWDVEAARAAAENFARMRGWTVDELASHTFTQMTDAILAEVVQFVSGCALPRGDGYPLGNDLGQWFFENSIHPRAGPMETAFRLTVPIIGIGAPAALFLATVAAKLHTELVLPEHYAVANAVGAVAGSVVATREAMVYPRLRDLSPVGYIAQVGDTHQVFASLAAASEFARAEAGRQAEDEAQRSGAVSLHSRIEEIPTSVGSLLIRARAVGSPRLMLDQPGERTQQASNPAKTGRPSPLGTKKSAHLTGGAGKHKTRVPKRDDISY